MSKYDRICIRRRRGALLTLERRCDGARVVLTAAGEVDISNAEHLRRALDTARDGDAPEIWLDLARLTFLDCRGLHALRDLRTRLLERDRRLVLIRPAAPVLRLLAVTGCDREFEIHPTAPPRRGR